MIPTVDEWIEKAYGEEERGEAKKRIVGRFKQEGPVSEGPFTIQTSERRSLLWLFTSAPLGEMPDGRKIIISTARDVTELHEKEEQMIAQSRQAAMGDMIAMIAHQWRQPITVIAMAANNIKLDIELEEEVTTEKLIEMTDTITEQTRHLSKTIDDFRNFFKPHKEREEVQIGDVVAGAMKIIGKSLENNNIAVEISDSSTQTVETYPNELLQVLLNILANAKDAHKNHNAEAPFIRIALSDAEAGVRIAICDNGGGIPDEALEKIGQPYFTTKTENGTGLGVYMSKTIIHKHLHGSLSWGNEGGGACFYVDLPLTFKKDAV